MAMSDRVHFSLAVAIVLAGVLFWGALAKAWNPAATTRILTLHWGLHHATAFLVAWVLAALEFALASWLLWSAGGRAALLAACMFLVAVSVSPLLQWARQDMSPCGCGLPEWAGRPLMVVFGRNVPLAVSALGAAWPARRNVSRLAEAQRED